MDEAAIGILAESLYRRRDEGVCTRYEKVSLGGRDPERGKCHQNANDWIKLHPEDVAVQGWHYVAASYEGTAKFQAHSVIERNRELLEITYPDVCPPFIRHVGASDEFLKLAISKPEICHVYDRIKRATFLDAAQNNLALGGVPDDEDGPLSDRKDKPAYY